MAANSQKRGKRSAAKEPEAEQPIEKNGWTIYAHPLILGQLDALAKKTAEEGADSEAAKVLKWLVGAMFEDVPQDPTRDCYRQGHTLGKQNTHWFRDKYAGRFRMFFRYNLRAKVIVYAWVNDENSKRAYGAKNDAYAVFKGMLAKGNPPSTWDELLKAASGECAVKRFKGKTPA